MENYSEGGSAMGGSAMNGEVPSVPITTLAGLASLTHLLPTLPLPTPLPQHAAGSALLGLPGLEEQARCLLQTADPGLASRLATALQACPQEFIQQGPGAAPATLSMPLAMTVQHMNPGAFGQCQPASQQPYGQMPSHGQNHHSQQVLVNGGGPEESQGHRAKSALRDVRKPPNGALEENGGGGSQYKIPKVNNAPGPSNARVTSNFNINMNKGLSKEHQALMTKSLSDLKVTSYNNLHSSPRMQRKKESQYKDMTDSEGSEEEDGSPRKRSKFFKHTEKERQEERAQGRADRRRRREEDEDFDPGEESRKRRYSDSEGEDEGAAWLKRRKVEEGNNLEDAPDYANFVPKKATRKIERKMLPMMRKMDAEELMESNNFKRFSRTIEAIFDQVEEVNMAELGEQEEDTAIPSELLVPKYQASELASEAAKLKSLQAMEQVPLDRLVKLLNILSWNIKDGGNVVPIPQGDDDDDEQEDDRMFLELVWDRVNRAADCAVCAMHVMTAKNMNKRVYQDDVIDRVAQFVRFHLQNTVYPSFDPVYKEMSKNKDGYIGSMKKKRTYAPSVKDRKILAIYNKCTELVSMLADLLHIQLLTDTTVLHLSTMGVAPFFVENIPELQLSSLKMVTGVFSKYDKHRKLILDDILASIARLPQTKRSLRTYRLNRTDNVQMLTALVMQLIQCVAVLPEKLAKKKGKNKNKEEEKTQENGEEGEEEELVVDRDVLVNNNYESAMATAYQFLTVFLKKCGSKSEDVDYRPLFDNFLQDLLTTVNTPEWPAAELLLSLLGKLLVSKFSNKGTEVSLRISSLDYLGMVASRLRRDAVQSRLKVDTIDAIIETVKEAEVEVGEEEEEDEELDEEEKRTRFLQRVLLDYLAVSGGEDDPQTACSRHFYISQWYRDSDAEIKKSSKSKSPRKKEKKEKRRRGRRGRDSGSETSESEEEEDADDEEANKPPNPVLTGEMYRLTEARKEYLVSKICPFGPTSKKNNTLMSHIDATAACLIVKYLSSKRPFFNSFDFYLKQILNVLTEQSIQVRSKALKCMAMVVQEDPSVLSRDDMQRGVNYSFLDAATMVREAAVDLVGKFILHRAELIDKYYEMLLLRILDTGVSVRKRVIKILKDICLGFPDYPKIPEICVKMIRRINDEEGIRKLVMDVFQNMWFQPMSERRRSEKEEHLLVTKAENITDVVVACHDTGLEWFEQLLQTLFKPKEDKDDATKVNKEPPRHLVVACQQIVDCLIETVLKSEERTIRETEDRTAGSSHRIVACLTTTFLFAKSRPQLLINHVQTLQPYLNVRCQTQGDYQIISNVARTLELVVPLIEHPSEIFLSQLEEASMKLILLHDKTVVSACLSCLGGVVNKVTKNFALIRDCFKKYFSHLVSFKKVHEKDSQDPRLAKATPFFRRSLFTVGLLLRHFDFGVEELYAGLEWGADTRGAVFDAIYYFMDHESMDIQNATLQAIGSICIRHYDFMMDERLKQRYISILTGGSTTTAKMQRGPGHTLQVLNNIETYLVEEEVRMMQLDKNWKEYAEKENLKEMGDVTSGMASTVIQIFLQSILDSFVHHAVQVRHAALKVIQLILAQGLVHPVQIVPYLICMSTDPEQRVSHTADKELQDIEKKYPGFIHMKLMKGVMLSFRLQELLQGRDEPLRGFRQKEGELPGALNGFLYSCLRSTKSQRRAILMNLLKQFDDTARNSLPMMLYLADNLAYIPYTVIDEPLFLIHHIDIMVSVIGCNILQAIKESLSLPAEYEIKFVPETGREEAVYDEDLDDDKNSVFSRLPADMTGFVESITTAQGCLLLLVLREHLKEFYGINEAKISAYSPSESQKIYERAVTRRAGAKFNPKAVVEILRIGPPDPATMDDEQKRETVENYMAFKNLMFKIDKDEDEYDEDGNVIPSHPQVSARELQNLGMPSQPAAARGAATNGYSAPPAPTIAASNLPAAMRGMNPIQFNPVIRMQNIPLSSLPGHQLEGLPAPERTTPRRESRSNSSAPPPAPVPESGGYLDPETGDWVEEAEESRSSRVARNTQESQKVPKLTINLGPKKPVEHAFFAEMDKNSRERDQRRGRKPHKPHKEKKKKKKKRYQSDSDSSDSVSDIECLS